MHEPVLGLVGRERITYEHCYGKKLVTTPMNDFYEEDLAYCHHVGFADRNLPAAVLSLLQQQAVTHGTVFDLGCNGGHLLAALHAAGYSPIGVDISAAAIAIAKTVAPGADLRVQNIATLEFSPCVAVTALGEVLCYAPDGRADSLSDDRLISRVFDALRPGGVFLFDSMIRDDARAFQYRNRRVAPDWTLEHAVREDIQLHRLYRDITLDRRVGGHWRRSRETHSLSVYSQDDIMGRLRDVGFIVEPAKRIGEIPTLPRRTAFICRKPPW